MMDDLTLNERRMTKMKLLIDVDIEYYNRLCVMTDRRCLCAGDRAIADGTTDIRAIAKVIKEYCECTDCSQCKVKDDDGCMIAERPYHWEVR